jgi:heme/copper-type cytochrome/quinol oxidase subunit 2
MKKIILGIVATVAMTLPMVMASTASAQFRPDKGLGIKLQVQDSGASGDLVDVIISVTRALLSVVFVLAVLMFVVSGIFYITSAGTDRTDMARDMITYSIIGLVVSVLGYAIIYFLSTKLTQSEGIYY